MGGMYQEALLLGRSGAVMRALSAVDTALWDLNARAAGLPLYNKRKCSNHRRPEGGTSITTHVLSLLHPGSLGDFRGASITRFAIR